MISGLWVRNRNTHPTSLASRFAERWDGGFPVAHMWNHQRLSVASSEGTLAGNGTRGVDRVGPSPTEPQQMSGALPTLGLGAVTCLVVSSSCPVHRLGPGCRVPP